MVAPIDARTEGWKRDLEKRVHFYPGSTHTLEVAAMSVQRPHIVVYDMHGHTGTRTLYEDIRYTGAYLIIQYYIIL